MIERRRKVKVVVISDVHLGFIGCKAKELNRYLKSIEPETLIINGDFIDIWQFRSYYFPKSHSKVLQRIFKFVSEGVKVHYLTGNHDEMLRRYSGLNLGNLELEDKLVLNLDGKKHWFFHGDIFDVTMRGSRWLAKLGTLGYEILILINKLVNFFLEFFGLVLSRVNAINRTNVDTRGVFGSDTGFGNDVSHLFLLETNLNFPSRSIRPSQFKRQNAVGRGPQCGTVYL
jgi:UDP-2,3-diacylglucosamine pyrophosphatase LpxH